LKVQKYMKIIIGMTAVLALLVVTLATTAQNVRAQASASQAPAKKTRNVKDTNEYDIFNEVIKDSQTVSTPAGAKKFLTDLDTWTQKYPSTEYKETREMYYVQAYAANNDPGKALDAAKPLIDSGLSGMKEGLDVDGSILGLLFVSSRAGAALAATGKPTPDQLATGLKASQLLVDFGKGYFVPEKKPASVSAADWADGLKQCEDQAKATQFQIALYPAASTLKASPTDPATCATAEGLYRKLLDQYPDAGLVAAQMASVSRCQQTTTPAKVQQAIFYYARAVSLPTGGVGGLDPKAQKELDDYLKRVYTAIHGSDEGLAQLKELAAKSPAPPADFKIKTSTEMANEAEEKFRTENPQLATWMGVKAQLADANGQQYFETGLKDTDMSGPNGTKLLKGKLVDAKPACRSKELLVAIPLPNATGAPVPEITIKLDAALTGKVETGAEIQFNGVPTAFVKDPFMLTMESSKDKIDGLNITPCAPPKAAPAKKKG
jgi:hypothetical protein